MELDYVTLLQFLLSLTYLQIKTAILIAKHKKIAIKKQRRLRRLDDQGITINKVFVLCILPTLYHFSVTIYPFTHSINQLLKLNANGLFIDNPYIYLHNYKHYQAISVTIFL